MNIIIVNFISLCLITYIGHSYLEYKYNSNKNIIILLITFILISLLNFNGASPSKAIILLFIYISYVFYIFKGNTINKLLVIFPFYTIQLLSEILTGFALKNILNITITSNPNSKEYTLALYLSSITLVLFSIIYVKLSKYIKSNSLPRYTWSIFILPLLTILLLVSVDDYFKFINTNPHLLILIILLALSNLILIIVFFISINNSNMKKELEIMQHKEKSMQMKYNLLNQHYTNNFHLLHDLLHRCNELNLYLENKDLNSLKKEIDDISNIVFKEFNMIYSNSVIVNYIINSHLNNIMENKITFKSVILCNEFEDLSFEEQLELFNYLIELGIDNCTKVKEENRIIILKSSKKHSQAIIQFIFPNTHADVETISQNLNSIVDCKKMVFSIKSKDNYISIILHLNKAYNY